MFNYLLVGLFLILNCVYILFLKDFSVEEKQTVVIEKGMKLSEVSKLLKTNNIIKSELAFEIWVKINFAEKNIKFGEYEFSGKTSPNKVFNKLKNGEIYLRKITIIEGSSKYDLFEKIKEIYPSNVVDFSDISNFVVADTYLFNFAEGPNKLIKNINEISKTILNELLKNSEITAPLKNKEEIFVLSSIIEKETSKDYERPVVSGVFYNRLNKGMRLQSDPTVVFSLTSGKGKLERKLLRKDLKFKSPYNTYINHGLPPLPICIPGKKSIEAAINPESNDFFYFVADPKKNEHIFSKEYRQHLKNIKKIKEFGTHD